MSGNVIEFRPRGNDDGSGEVVEVADPEISLGELPFDDLEQQIFGHVLGSCLVLGPEAKDEAVAEIAAILELKVSRIKTILECAMGKLHHPAFFRPELFWVPPPTTSPTTG